VLRRAGLDGRFDPAAFSPERVQFDDRRERWKVAFEQPDDPAR
jgi:hypothetical protein